MIVNGPSPARASAKPAAFTAATRILNSFFSATCTRLSVELVASVAFVALVSLAACPSPFTCNTEEVLRARRKQRLRTIVIVASGGVEAEQSVHNAILLLRT